MGLFRTLITWISIFFYQRKLIISINDQPSDLITLIHDVPQGPLSPNSVILYVSDIPQSTDAHVNLSVCWWHRNLGTGSRYSQYQPQVAKIMNQILTWCERWRIKLNPRKTHLTSFSQRKVFNDTSIIMYSQPLKTAQ